MKQFYIADWHYGHKNCIGFDRRPFSSLDEMDRELVERWNHVVSADDIVYVLGDMFWCPPRKAIPILEQLAGAKVLIKGNHDRPTNEDVIGHFTLITDYLEIKDGDRDVVLCHYPIPCFKNHFYGWYHLYGHVHTSFEYDMMEQIKRDMIMIHGRECRMFNVGAMMPWMDYTPRTLDEVIVGVQETILP